MIINHATTAQLNAALEATNAAHGYQLTWKSGPTATNRAGTRHTCTIRSKFSRIKGSRTSAAGRATIAASWHAHGHFFEAVLALAPNAIIRTGLHGEKRITAQGGNWQDSSVGSTYAPAMLSSLSVL